MDGSEPTGSRHSANQGTDPVAYTRGNFIANHGVDSFKGVEVISRAGPYIAHLESQYSWAHMDPSAHSLAFRGGAEVPDEEGCYISAACVSRVQGPPTPRTPTTDEEQSYTGGSRTRLVQP